MPRAWALNLDAELELEAWPRAYMPSEAIRARTIAIARTIALPSGDRVIDPLDEDRAGCDRGRAWCPTPRAIVSLGDLPIEGIPIEVLRRVNERGFAHALSEGELPGAIRATSIAEIDAQLARGGEWLLKRAFGVAGRGQRPVRGPLSPDDRMWIAASLRRDALYVEPRVEIVRELSVHGWATERAHVRSIREQTLRDRAWIASAPARDLDPATERALIDRAEQVASALIATGYRGPFGIDAFEWRTSTGARALRTLSEINARYCMGWDDRDLWDPP